MTSSRSQCRQCQILTLPSREPRFHFLYQRAHSEIGLHRRHGYFSFLDGYTIGSGNIMKTRLISPNPIIPTPARIRLFNDNIAVISFAQPCQLNPPHVLSPDVRNIDIKQNPCRNFIPTDPLTKLQRKMKFLKWKNEEFFYFTLL